MAIQFSSELYEFERLGHLFWVLVSVLRRHRALVLVKPLAPVGRVRYDVLGHELAESVVVYVIILYLHD